MHESRVTAVPADRTDRLRRLQALFLEDALGEVAELGRILAAASITAPPEADDGRARKIAHDLRGTGGSYGFAAVSEAAAVLEDSLLAGWSGARLESLARELAVAVYDAHRSFQARTEGGCA
ncbi:MAG: hypothetical protein E4H03_11350 [Myxococcales bacterium]|jgi:HPt (histidine-containing phosphotransfer) domain-containing protein|nr:MAG: hypothetical protein E4H03_11350 [Myxococcales bacterium]